MTSTTDRPDAGRAIVATLRDLSPAAPTACVGWTAHHVAAHLAAGSREIADLAEARAAGRPPRPTRAFEERERPYRALPYVDVLEEMAVQTRRKLAAYEAIARLSDEPCIDFTGTTITVDELTTHSRSEAALHRWDLIGDDALADELLADPDLTAHAVKILNRMPTLAESARSIAVRAAAHHSPRIVLRAPGRPDVGLDTGGHGHVALGGSDPLHGDLIITTDPANRLLALWGRRSTQRPVSVDGPAELTAAVPAILWPHARPWPPAPDST
jgi:uncharacterized protein (TIGR03083 family)